MYVACPFCQSVLQVPDGASGPSLCPACNNAFQVGAPATAPTAPASPVPQPTSLGQYASQHVDPAARQALPTLQSHLPDSADVPAMLSAAESPLRPSPQRRAARSRPARFAMGPLFIVQIVLGGLIGLAAGYGIIKFLADAQDKEKPPPKQQVDRPRDGRRTERTVIQPPAPAPVQSPAVVDRAEPSSVKDEPGIETGVARPDRASVEETKIAAEPARPLTRLERLPREVELPSLLKSEAATLLSFEGEPQKITWELQSALADVPEGASYFLQADQQKADTWYVCFASDAEAIQSPLKVARLVEQPEGLTFQWAKTTGIEEEKRQLRNCLLLAQADQQQRVVQLRSAKVMPGPKLNLEQRETEVALDLYDLPRIGALQLELEAIGNGAFERSLSRAAEGKEITFEFADLVGAQLIGKLIRNKAAGTVNVRFSPVFDEKVGRDLKFEFTRPKLAEMRERWTDAGNKATASLKQAQATVSAGQKALSALGPKPKGANSAVQLKWEQQYVAISARIKAAAERIPVQQRKVAEMSARVSAIPRVEAFLNDHHNRLDLRYRVFAQSGDQQVLLVEARQPSADASALSSGSSQ